MWNVHMNKNVHNVHKHRMFIRIGIRKTRNTDDSLGPGTKLLLPSLSLGFQHKERETHTIFLCWLFVHRQLSTHQRACAPRSPQTHWPRPGPKNQLASSKSKSLCFYSKSLRIPAHRFQAWRHLHPQPYFLSRVFIVTSVIVTSSPHAHEYLHSMCAPN